jgi:hypothetical protein
LAVIIFLVIFVINLAVPFYNRTGPALFGFPFFYWYQMVAVPVSSLLIYVVFRAEDRRETEE